MKVTINKIQGNSGGDICVQILSKGLISAGLSADLHLRDSYRLALFSDPILAEKFRILGYDTVQLRFSWGVVSIQFWEAFNHMLSIYSEEGVQ